MNPFSDFFGFLRRSGTPMIIFYLLLLGSVAIAGYNLWRHPQQRTVRDVWTWLARLLVGGMWFQQTLWKWPPTYTDNPDGISGGLHYWVGEMTKYAAFELQGSFVKNIVQPNFYFFAPQVWATEVFIAVSLMLGLFTRAGGALGALMAINLWLGLYRAPYEWPWTYFFLILLQTTFAVLGVGRSLGLDAILVRRAQLSAPPKGIAAKALAWLS